MLTNSGLFFTQKYFFKHTTVGNNVGSFSVIRFLFVKGSELSELLDTGYFQCPVLRFWIPDFISTSKISALISVPDVSTKLRTPSSRGWACRLNLSVTGTIQRQITLSYHVNHIILIWPFKVTVFSLIFRWIQTYLKKLQEIKVFIYLWNFHVFLDFSIVYLHQHFLLEF